MHWTSLTVYDIVHFSHIPWIVWFFHLIMEFAHALRGVSGVAFFISIDDWCSFNKTETTKTLCTLCILNTTFSQINVTFLCIIVFLIPLQVLPTPLTSLIACCPASRHAPTADPGSSTLPPTPRTRLLPYWRTGLKMYASCFYSLFSQFFVRTKS